MPLSAASQVAYLRWFHKIVDPLILYYGGYRYNQPNHLYHMFLMSHAFAYFTYDSIIEIYYRTDDFLTNMHHVCVLISSYCHITSPNCGFEYIGNLQIFYSNEIV
jgi:hypothetical protein